MLVNKRQKMNQVVSLVICHSPDIKHTSRGPQTHNLEIRSKTAKRLDGLYYQVLPHHGLSRYVIFVICLLFNVFYMDKQDRCQMKRCDVQTEHYRDGFFHADLLEQKH